MKDGRYVKANYSVKIELAKFPKDVFDSVIDLSKWWPEEFIGESITLNSEFVFRTGESHYSKNKVVEFVSNKKVVWLTTESLRKTDNFDWTGTKFIFELIPNGHNTLLKFTYDGVVLENESDRLIQICDVTIKEMFYNFVTNGKKNKSFTTSMVLSKSPKDVFDVITTDVSKWWGGKDLEGSSTNLNDEFVVHHPHAHYSKQKLIEVIPNTKIVWLVTESTLHWLEKDKHEWANTKMIFEITTAADKTVLQFTHEGLIPEKECYLMCREGWTKVIKDWLFNFIMNGKVANQLYH